MTTDALVYATMKNKLSTDAELADLVNKIRGTYQITVGTSDANAKAKANLDKILNKTQIKRACCNASNKINVRIPLPAGIVAEGGDAAKLITKFGYYDKQVNVPIETPGFCSIDSVQYSKGSPDCDDFYNVYCANAVKEFTAGNGGNFDYTQFGIYKPECACFVPKPEWLKQAWGGDPTPKCVFAGCGENAVSYLDAISRTGPCNYTICSQQINTGNIDISTSGSLVNNLTAQCGTQGKNPFVSPTGAPVVIPPPPPSTTAPTTFTNTMPPPSSNTSPTTEESNSSTFSSITKYATTTNYIISGLAYCCCCVFIIIMLFLVMRKNKRN